MGPSDLILLGYVHARYLSGENGKFQRKGRYPLRIGKILPLGQRFQRNQTSDIPINDRIDRFGDNLYGLFRFLYDSDWTFPPPPGSAGEKNSIIHDG